MQHFSNYFVQILVIRSKCQAGGGGKDGRGRGQLEASPYFPRLWIRRRILKLEQSGFCI